MEDCLRNLIDDKSCIIMEDFMKYTELPKKHQKTAIQWAIDGWNEIYKNEGIKIKVTKDSPEVLQILEDSEYIIECGNYEKGVPYERLVKL